MKSGAKWLLALAAVATAGGGWYASQRDGAAEPGWRLAAVDRGPIALTISSSGKLNPVTTVSVGSQVSGQISELLADFNTHVAAGQVIARIDPLPFEARVQEGRAELAFARANVAIQKATLAEFRANRKGARAALLDAEQELARKQKLLARRVVAASAVEKAVAARDQARADLDSVIARLAKQEAQVESADAQVAQKAATLRQRELDLGHTIIRSPVDGVVINRSVDIGQTVAASLQAPVLFTIARDLRKMQVETSVDEADIGRIREDQAVRFTVDAYPQRSFRGTVRQIRKAPLEVSNVVTYTVVVSADNPDLALLPGMTANVEVIIGRRADALRVPNAALRFSPPGAAPLEPVARPGAGPGQSPDERRAAARRRMEARIARFDKQLGLTPAQKQGIADIYRDMGRRLGMLRRGGASDEKVRSEVRALRAESNRRIAALLDEAQEKKFRTLLAEQADTPPRAGRVWIRDADGSPRAVEVTIGLSDGTKSEIRRGDLKEGDAVIVGTAAVASRR